MSREKRAKKSVGTMNGWENCDVPAENPLSLSTLVSFVSPDDGEVPTILLHLVSKPRERRRRRRVLGAGRNRLASVAAGKYFGSFQLEKNRRPRCN